VSQLFVTYLLSDSPAWKGILLACLNILNPWLKSAPTEHVREGTPRFRTEPGKHIRAAPRCRGRKEEGKSGHSSVQWAPQVLSPGAPYQESPPPPQARNTAMHQFTTGLLQAGAREDAQHLSPRGSQWLPDCRWKSLCLPPCLRQDNLPCNSTPEGPVDRARA
jgi:hypothetical protein